MKTKELTYISLLMSLTILLGVVPNIGIIQVGVISITILHLPVIVASVLLKTKGGFIVGLTFGLVSMYVAATRGATPLDLLFVNPLISVLPRAVFGLLCGILCQLIKDEKKWKYALIGFISTLLHTFLVYLALYIWGKETIDALMGNQTLAAFLISAISINAILEATVAAIVASVLIYRVKKARITL